MKFLMENKFYVAAAAIWCRHATVPTERATRGQGICTSPQHNRTCRQERGGQRKGRASEDRLGKMH